MDYFCVITFQNNSLHLHYSVLQYKTLSYFQETFMTFFIQMCSICIIFAVLKIYFSKMIIICINSSFSGAVKNRNTIISTNLNHSIHHFLSITSRKVFTVPSGKEKILAVGYFSISPSHSIASLSLNTSIPPIESNLKPSLCPPTTIT